MRLIVADLSFDPTYADVLYETFGKRVIGLQIGRYGDGRTFERRPVKDGVDASIHYRQKLFAGAAASGIAVRSVRLGRRVGDCAVPMNNSPIWSWSFVKRE